MKIAVLGCGRWGTFLAWYVNRIGHETMLWGRGGSKNYYNLYTQRKNDYLKLPAGVQMTNSLQASIDFADYLIISISSQELRGFAKDLNRFNLRDKKIILCMKGIENTTGKRLSQVVKEEIGFHGTVAVWLGPGHVQDFIQGIPNCMVIGSDDIGITKDIIANLNSDLIRFYYGQDMIGNEIGAAAKNVIGIAAGMLDGFGYSSLKGALMARGTREISRLIKAMGGNELTAYGLTHLGDYEATLFSDHSQNRAYGKSLIEGREFRKLAEGVSTVSALMILSKKHEVELPICQAVNNIIVGKHDPKEALLNLFIRPIKFEF